MTMINKEQIQILSQLMNRTITKQEETQLTNFISLFKFYNAHTNLVSKNDEKMLFEKHIYDSLAISLFFQKNKISSNASILDIGTGGGFPSIPIGIFYPDMKIYPLDSIAKKIGFVELVQKELRLDNLNPTCDRVENLANKAIESFDIVTSRAVASLNTLLEYSIPFAKVNTYFVAFKSKGADTEISQAQNAMKTLNCTIVDRIKYSLPCEENYARELVVFKKTAPSPIIYPRKSGLAKKSPL